MKLIIIYDIEEEELTDFPWDEDGEVQPVVKPRVKKKEKKHDAKIDKEEKS